MPKSIFNDIDIQLPEQIHKAAVEYLPAFLSAEDTEVLAVQALLIARAFHGGGTFEQVFTGAEPITQHYQINLIRSFEKNVRLLVDKMWVEKADEDVKEDILYRLRVRRVGGLPAQHLIKQVVPLADAHCVVFVQYVGVLVGQPQR